MSVEVSSDQETNKKSYHKNASSQTVASLENYGSGEWNVQVHDDNWNTVITSPVPLREHKESREQKEKESLIQLFLQIFLSRRTRFPSFSFILFLKMSACKHYNVSGNTTYDVNDVETRKTRSEIYLFYFS